MFLDLETEETINDFRGRMPFGVSIYLFFKILETVEGWSLNSSDISLLVNVSIFIGLFLKKPQNF